MLIPSAIKADIGSVGGHTGPSSRMLQAASDQLAQATPRGLIIDYDVTHTGDDICLLMVHDRGNDAPAVHQ